ncbi:MAG: hypothetical protein K9K65_17220 [Desulfarculaceae bacterium]|nr:hypothetical protein [Desulfarculaceae bacterium]MCF8048061.1 hypothetical protein [Desulfarculaceae bacterium]MCF8099584.1 hypothetical protein [Desulfarculaceae bacterium]
MGKMVKCEYCDGTGGIWEPGFNGPGQVDICPVCLGSGEVEEQGELLGFGLGSPLPNLHGLFYNQEIA